jgi:hypothetical protein
MSADDFTVFEGCLKKDTWSLVYVSKKGVVIPFRELSLTEENLREIEKMTDIVILKALKNFQRAERDGIY